MSNLRKNEEREALDLPPQLLLQADLDAPPAPSLVRSDVVSEGYRSFREPALIANSASSSQGSPSTVSGEVSRWQSSSR